VGVVVPLVECEMSPKKDGKRVVLMETVEEVKSLAEAGALPPSEGSEDGLVEREIDVLSEEPDVDTTRAEEKPPDKRRWFCLLCCFIPLAATLFVLAITGAAYATSHSNCTVTQVLHKLHNISSTNFEEDAVGVYDACVKV
jgi:hypothetical protein